MWVLYIEVLSVCLCGRRVITEVGRGRVGRTIVGGCTAQFQLKVQKDPGCIKCPV